MGYYGDSGFGHTGKCEEGCQCDSARFIRQHLTESIGAKAATIDNSCDFCTKQVTREQGYIMATFTEVSRNPNLIKRIGQLYFCNLGCQINFCKGFEKVRIRQNEKTNK